MRIHVVYKLEESWLESSATNHPLYEPASSSPPLVWYWDNRRATSLAFPGGSVVKNPPAMQNTQVWSLGGEDPPEEEGMATHSSILAWRIPWAEEPGGYSPWGRKESDTTERLNTSHLMVVVRTEVGDGRCLAHYPAHTTGRCLQGRTTINIQEGNISRWQSWHGITPVGVLITHSHGYTASESGLASEKWK